MKMKAIFKKSWLLLLVGAFACTDLNVSPKGSADSSTIFSSPEGYTKFLAKIYNGLSHTGQEGPASDTPETRDIQTGDEGFSQYTRGLWNAEEMPTDEAVTLWGDPNLKDYHAHNWTSQSAFLTQFYYRIFYQISLANLFLREITDAKMAERGMPANFINVTAKVYRAEARTLRALSYWHGLNYFRNIPFTDENSGTGKPPQATAQQIFDFVESELMAVEADLLPQRTNQYGRFDRGVANMILAKLYLNAEVYIGTPKYAECVAALNKIIAPTGGGVPYTLSPGYQDNFLTDNDTSPEMIFGIPADGKNMPNYGGVTLIINGAIGGSLGALNPPPPARNPIMGNNASWAGHRTTASLVDLFPDETGTLDSRALWYSTGQQKAIDDINQFSHGYMVTKFRNVDKFGTPGSDPTFTDTDYPLFRYADVLLMYAEAVTRDGAAGSAAQALTYANQVRSRAFPSAAPLTSITLDFLLDERGREFYWEGHRRTDMIRFDVFTDNPGGSVRGLWPWKGNVKDGRLTESFRNIYPIPATDIIANPNLVQNPGY